MIASFKTVEHRFQGDVCEEIECIASRFWLRHLWRNRVLPHASDWYHGLCFSFSLLLLFCSSPHCSQEIICPSSDDWSSVTTWKYIGVTALGMSVWVFLERSYCGRKDIPCSWVVSGYGWNKEKMRKQSHTDASIPLCSAAICFLGHWNVHRQSRQSTATARIHSCPRAFRTMMD